MSRKHYRALAGALLPAREGMLASDFARLVDRVADVLQADNPRFDRDRFETACGLVRDVDPIVDYLPHLAGQ